MQSTGILRDSGSGSMIVRSKGVCLLLLMITVFSAASAFGQCSVTVTDVKHAWSDGPGTYPEPGNVHRVLLNMANNCGETAVQTLVAEDCDDLTWTITNDGGVLGDVSVVDGQITFTADVNEAYGPHTIYAEASDGLAIDDQWGTFFVTDGSCCTGGSVGNVDASMDNLVTMGDLTVLIDHLFISLTPVICPAEANVDMSADGRITMGDLTILIDHLFISLSPLDPCPEQSLVPSGTIISHGECKTGKGTLDDPSTTQDCIDWSFENGTLSLNHINAGFNCCPVILADITVEGNLIVITEIDSLDGGGCDCNCLFDVQYEISGLQAGVYQLVVEEPYRQNPDEPIDFLLDLSTTSDGRHCEGRTVYPWGTL